MPHFHLPVQSGFDAVLARMRRDYGVERYLERLGGSGRRAPASPSPPTSSSASPARPKATSRPAGAHRARRASRTATPSSSARARDRRGAAVNGGGLGRGPAGGRGRAPGAAAGGAAPDHRRDARPRSAGRSRCWWRGPARTRAPVRPHPENRVVNFAAGEADAPPARSSEPARSRPSASWPASSPPARGAAWLSGLARALRAEWPALAWAALIFVVSHQSTRCPSRRRSTRRTRWPTRGSTGGSGRFRPGTPGGGAGGAARAGGRVLAASSTGSSTSGTSPSCRGETRIVRLGGRYHRGILGAALVVACRAASRGLASAAEMPVIRPFGGKAPVLHDSVFVGDGAIWSATSRSRRGRRSGSAACCAAT